jgi:hypothetical protein
VCRGECRLEDVWSLGLPCLFDQNFESRFHAEGGGFSWRERTRVKRLLLQFCNGVVASVCESRDGGHRGIRQFGFRP